LVLTSAVILRSESRGTYDQIFLPQIRDSPNLEEGQVPIFVSTRNRVTQLYPQALGSLFVASYDSQDFNCPPYNTFARAEQKIPFPTVACISAAAGT
jgi:hypothetical protein